MKVELTSLIYYKNPFDFKRTWHIQYDDDGTVGVKESAFMDDDLPKDIHQDIDAVMAKIENVIINKLLNEQNDPTSQT